MNGITIHRLTSIKAEVVVFNHFTTLKLQTDEGTGIDFFFENEEQALAACKSIANADIDRSEVE